MRNSDYRSRLALTVVAIGMTGIGGSNAADGLRNANAGATVAVQSTTTVPSGQRFDLRAYGTRFKLAIEAVEKNSRKPEWTWDDSDNDGRSAKTKQN